MNIREDLTKQEGNVLALVAQGRRNADIARELYVSVRTIESHLHSIFKKLGISSRTEAVVYAFESGLFLKSEFSGSTQGKEERKH